VTIACVIGKSRMKGERIVTTLLPYGPEKPRAGMIKATTTNEVEIMWDPPKGEFTKYVLVIDPNVTSVTCKKKRVSTFSIARQNTGGCGMVGTGGCGSVTTGCQTGPDGVVQKFDRSDTVEEYELSADCWQRELSSKLTNFTLLGLNPGEAYILKLLTKTGDRETRKPIFEIVLTKPEPINMLCVEDVQVDRANIRWLVPEGHPHLRAFNIACASRDNKFRRDLAVKVATEKGMSALGSGLNSYMFENLPSETEITVSIASVCVLDNHKSMSRREKITFVTRPRPPEHLELEGRFCNSLTVSWVPPLMLSTNFHKYKLSIHAPAIGYKNSSELAGDRDAFNFSKLPEIIGSGKHENIETVLDLVFC
jgi:hypothetical protein